MGPGLTKVNSNILEDSNSPKIAKTEIKSQIEQIPEDWDPHKRLEYLKVTIWSLILDLVGRNQKETQKEI